MSAKENFRCCSNRLHVATASVVMACVWLSFCVVDLYLSWLSARKRFFLIAVGFFIVNAQFVVFLAVGISQSSTTAVFFSLLFVIFTETSMFLVVLFCIIAAPLLEEINVGLTLDEMAICFAVCLAQIMYLFWMSVVLHRCYLYLCDLKKKLKNSHLSLNPIRSYPSYHPVSQFPIDFPIG